MLQHAAPVALLLLAAMCGACSSSSAAPRYRTEAFGETVVTAGIAYRSSPALQLDLYEPKGDRSSRRPAVVWVHGGGFAGGDRASFVIPMPTALAKAGYVVASIDYRLAAKAPCVAAPHLSDDCRAAADVAIDDAQAAVRWLRANAASQRVDPDRIAIAGESAGGITAAGVGTRAADGASTVRAWISISGGIDRGIGVDRGDARGLLFAGTDDAFIPYQWSVDAKTAMDHAGVEAQLVTLDGAGHVPGEETDRFVRDSLDFLRRALDL